MATVLGAAVGALVTLVIAITNRDPYHGLRKALDIYADLPEPFKSAWVDEVRMAYLSSDVRMSRMWAMTIGMSAITVANVAIAVWLDSWTTGGLVLVTLALLCLPILIYTAFRASRSSQKLRSILLRSAELEVAHSSTVRPGAQEEAASD